MKFDAPKPVPKAHIFSNIGVAGLAFAAEVYLLYHLSFYIVGHIFIAALLLGFLVIQKYSNWDLRYGWTTFLYTAVLGPFGAGISLLAYLLDLLYRRLVSPFAELILALFPPLEENPSLRYYERVIYGLDKFDPERIPVAFKDIMQFGSYKQKRITMEKCLRYFRPSLAPILMMGLNDESNSVRVQAATAISTINKQYFDKYLTYKKRVYFHPDNLDLKLDLANYCEQYSDLGLLDPDRGRNIREEAIEIYKEVNPQSDKIKLKLGKLLLQNNLPEEALHYLKQLPVNFETVKYLLQAQYKLGNFDEMHKLTDFEWTPKEEERIPERDLEILRLWKNGIPQRVMEAE